MEKTYLYNNLSLRRRIFFSLSHNLRFVISLCSCSHPKRICAISTIFSLIESMETQLIAMIRALFGFLVLNMNNAVLGCHNLHF